MKYSIQLRGICTPLSPLILIICKLYLRVSIGLGLKLDDKTIIKRTSKE